VETGVGELLGVLLVAMLYSSVGHAGASGYVAVLTLAGMSAHGVRPIALLLNIVVSAVASYKFARAGYFRRGLFLPLVVGAMPAAALGGYIYLPNQLLSRIMGGVLCFSALWLWVRKREVSDPKVPSRVVLVVTGILLGFLAGLSGTGGGVFLSPLMVFMGWAKLREISAVAAPFIFCNSISGVVGLSFSGATVAGSWAALVVAVLIGGVIGSSVGVRYLSGRYTQLLLGAVLVIAGAKLFFL
jgi:hypothetical protein